MNDSLKQKTISGMIWSGVQRFGTLGISFISNMVLARMLSPDDFGCIGMLMIFIAISNTFIDGGFGSALIQKKEPTQNDYSTIFYWNIFLSVVLYGVLYLAAPFIAGFYHIALLSDVLRVQGVVLIINAFSIIQSNQLRKRLQFKKLASINVAAALVSVCVAITLAFLGWGVWSLVAQQLSLGFFTALFLWIFNRWKPALVFSWRSFKELFGFGGFILVSNLINNVCDNIQGLLIGKFFNPTTMGLYAQARKIEEIATTSISGIVNQVAYPVLANKQSDKITLINALKKFITFIAFVVFPLMFLLILIAEPLIIFLYSDKWIACIPYFRILCIAGLAISLQMINYNAVAAIGKSDVLFRWTLIKRSLGLIFNITGLLIWGIYGLLCGGVLTAFTLYIINAHLVSKHIGYKVTRQLADLAPIISTTVITFLITGVCHNIINTHIYINGVITIILYVIIYLTLSYYFNSNVFNEFKEITIELLQKKLKRC